MNNNKKAFFALVRAGLWGVQRSVQEFNVQELKDVDWERVYQLAQEQSIQGVVLRGIEELRAKGLELSVPRVLLLQWIGEVRYVEQQNKDMNVFVAELFGQLREAGINAVLVKGQGIAQCYEKPLWRLSGDVDLLLDAENYEKAKALLLAQATDVETEYAHFKHLGMTISGFTVELHGTLHCRLSKHVDKVIDAAQKDVLCGGNVRSWQNGQTMVSLPSVDDDVIFVFTHILKHFFIEGIGLRQICDWCRLLYTYKDSLDYKLLEARIREAGILTEWKAFAALAVDWLGMSVEMMPLYSSDKKWGCKAKRIMGFVLESGNFGHNRTKSIAHSNSKIGNKMCSFIDHTRVIVSHSTIFPFDAIKVWWNMMVSGMEILMNH